jgi:DNA polymerase-3 subunit gamma/tau
VAAADAAAASADAMSQSMWDDTVKPGLRGMTRAVFSPATYVSNTDTVLTLSLPNAIHRDKCEQHRVAVEQALTSAVGGPVSLELVLAGGGESSGPSGSPSGGPATTATATRSAESTTAAPSPANEPPMDPGHPAANPQADSAMADAGDVAVEDTAPQRPTESPRRAAERKAAEAQANGTSLDADDDLPTVTEAEIHVLPEDHEVDLTELVDAPPETVKTPIDRLAEAFPGSELVTESY